MLTLKKQSFRIVNVEIQKRSKKLQEKRERNMTNKEREVLQGIVNSQLKLQERKDEAFKRLQELSRDLGLDVWCSAYANLEQLRDRKEKYTKYGCNTTYGEKAQYEYDNYMELCGRVNQVWELGDALAKVGFWK